MIPANLSTISIYPVKSLRGHNLSRSSVETMGLKNDRRLMVVDPEGMFMTQREHAHMTLIHPQLEDGLMTLSAPGMSSLQLEVRSQGQRAQVEIWSSRNVEAIDQGDQAAEWLSDFLNVSVRLVRIADDFHRTIHPDYAISDQDRVGFADGFPILIVSQESLDDLNSRLEKPVPMDRFRPNLVVKGVSPFDEDRWKRIRIGEIELALVKPCARCNIPTIDQQTAETGKEPNTTLAKYRKINGKIMFGVNVIPITTGVIQIGDAVQVLE